MSFIERFRALPAGWQIACAGATALVIAAILALAWFAMRPKYEVLFTDLRPADAATILAALEEDNLPHKITGGGATILAPAERVDEIRLGIMGSDLPLKGTVGFELFNKSDMGLTEFAQRINYQRALQGELARTIMTIEAVDTARVHLTLPEPSIFRAERRPAEASVTLTTRPGRALTAQTVLGIQRLVGAAAPDLEAANVVVLDAQGAPVAGAPVAASATAGISAGLEQVRAIEQYYAAAARLALEPLYPGVRVVVLVPADQWPINDEAVRDEALGRWRPDGRDFRMQVSVSAPGGFSASQRDDVGRIVASETGWSAERGDLMLFPEWTAQSGLTESEEAVSPAGPAQDAAPTPVIRPSAPPPLGWVIAALSALGLLALIVTLRGRVPKDGTLSADEREAYVRRLRRLLAEEGGHVG